MGDYWLVPVLGWVGVTVAAVWAVGRENMRLRAELRDVKAASAERGLYWIAHANRRRDKAVRVLRRVWKRMRSFQRINASSEAAWQFEVDLYDAAVQRLADATKTGAARVDGWPGHELGEAGA